MKRIVHMKTNQYEMEAKPRFEVLDGLRGVAAAGDFAASWARFRIPSTSCIFRSSTCRWRG